MVLCGLNIDMIGVTGILRMFTSIVFRPWQPLPYS
jgi:hypothetical protein